MEDHSGGNIVYHNLDAMKGKSAEQSKRPSHEANVWLKSTDQSKPFPKAAIPKNTSLWLWDANENKNKWVPARVTHTEQQGDLRMYTLTFNDGTTQERKLAQNDRFIDADEATSSAWSLPYYYNEKLKCSHWNIPLSETKSWKYQSTFPSGWYTYELGNEKSSEQVAPKIIDDLLKNIQRSSMKAYSEAYRNAMRTADDAVKNAQKQAEKRCSLCTRPIPECTCTFGHSHYTLKTG